MIIECTECHTRYQYDVERFERQPSKKIRCAKCKSVFEIQNPAFQSAPPPRRSATDETAVRKAPEWEGHSGTTGTDETDPGDDPAGLAAGLELPRDRRFSLAITEGPEAAKVFRLEKPRVIIGRSNTDVVINDPESSREHAAVEIRGGSVYLRDLDSRNGTFVDGEQIQEPVQIENHTEFRIGGTTLMLIVTDAE